MTSSNSRRESKSSSYDRSYNKPIWCQSAGQPTRLHLGKNVSRPKQRNKALEVTQQWLTPEPNQPSFHNFYFTKWPDVFASPNQTAETIARLLVEHVISQHGVPELLLSDHVQAKQRMPITVVSGKRKKTSEEQ